MKGKILLIGLLALAVTLSGCTTGTETDGNLAGGPNQITAEGQSLEMAISPSVNNTVKGTVSLKASNAASGVNIIVFSIYDGAPPPTYESSPYFCDVPYDGSGICDLDTTQYGNGPYTVSALAYGDNIVGSPEDVASAQIVIEN